MARPGGAGRPTVLRGLGELTAVGQHARVFGAGPTRETVWADAVIRPSPAAKASASTLRSPWASRSSRFPQYLGFVFAQAATPREVEKALTTASQRLRPVIT